MSKASTKTVVVIGATGAMGRPVVRQLLADPEHPWRVRAFTRDPASRHARALADLDPARVELARGDLNDAAALGRALAGADAVFCNTDFWSSLSVETEFEQGTRVLEAARAAGVGHVVYSSLDDCTQLSGGRLPVPHYDAKAAVEHAIDRRRSDEFMRRDRDGFYSRRVSVLVTGPYYENLCNFFLPARGRLADGREGLTFSLAAGDKPFPMV
ncbi:MAG TPA: NmrA family NAD(P)-binding protein, partial [Polyangiaceae bacterium]|nr:NmrA family NAD(P)-binding protein [Polyangiaceae bacterium]